MTKFSWAKPLITDSDFQGLMEAIDQALSDEGVKPEFRPIHVGKKLWEAFEWSGRLTPPENLADEPGYQGDILMAKADRWYKQTLGSRLKFFLVLGYIPAKIGNIIWRVRLNEFAGTVNFFLDRNLLNRGSSKGNEMEHPSVNILSLVEDLPQSLVDRLSDEELKRHFNYHMLAVNSLQWRNNLPHTNLLNAAKDDYHSSTQEIMAHSFSQARWAAQQCVEKTLKGILELVDGKYQTGRNGHNLNILSENIEKTFGLKIHPTLLNNAHCATAARYREEPSTQQQAFQANLAALGIYDTLNNSHIINLAIQDFKTKQAHKN